MTTILEDKHLDDIPFNHSMVLSYISECKSKGLLKDNEGVILIIVDKHKSKKTRVANNGKGQSSLLRPVSLGTYTQGLEHEAVFEVLESLVSRNLQNQERENH